MRKSDPFAVRKYEVKAFLPMLKIILFGALWCAALPCHGQQAIEIRNFTAAQKAEWQRFMQTWTGNGNGTCMPIMHEQISAGQCTRFDFTADVTIGKNGNISKVNVLKSQIVCQDKAVQKELLQCFTQALRDDMGVRYFYKLSNRVVRNAAL